MLRQSAILDTLLDGCKQGWFALRSPRPDGSAATFWRVDVPAEAMREPLLEIVLPEAAQLETLPPDLVEAGALPGLWTDGQVRVGDVHKYFGGGHSVQVPREGFEESLTVPKADQPVINAAIRQAVTDGRVWLTTGPVSLLLEPVPPALVTGEAVLHAPPSPISPLSLLPETLPGAWHDDGETTPSEVMSALAGNSGVTFPWPIVRDALESAVKSRLLEIVPASGAWSSQYEVVQNVRLRRLANKPEATTPLPPTLPVSQVSGVSGEAELGAGEIQDLADVVGDIVKAAVGLDITFRLRIELGAAGERPSQDVVDAVNEVLRNVSSEFRLV